ncbi:MAG: hypothetical protein V3R64_04760 [Sphingomonadales bacterium]
MNSFFAELKRRNVFKVGVAYAIVAWVILQFIEVVSNVMNFPDWIAQAVFMLLVAGLPVALLLSWAYEVTPEGVKKTAEVDQSKSINHGTGQRINKLIAGALVVVLGFIAYDKLIAIDGRVVPQVEAGQASIAVLPFEDLSAAGDQEYFGDGIAEELLNVLAKVPSIKVAGRTSSFQFKGESPDLRAIGKTLGVEHILEGSVRTDGNMVRITAQLINARDGFHVWSETYDREMTSIFAIQDEIAGNIATELLGTLGAGELPKTRTGGTENVEAYNLYLQAKFVRGARSEETLRQAEGLLKRAVEQDPSYANAWGALAKVYTLLRYYGHISRAEAAPLVENAAGKALALDPENSEALATLGNTKVDVELDFLGALAFYDRAIKSNPNDIEAHHWRNLLLDVMGRFPKASQGFRENYERDPYYQIILTTYLSRLGNSGNLDEVKRVLATISEGQLGQGFEFTRAFIQLGIALMEGNIPEAEKYLAKYEELLGGPTYLGRYGISRSEEDKQQAFSRALAGYEAGQRSDENMAYLYTYFGDYDAALPFARRFVKSRPQAFLLALIISAHPDVDPRFDRVYNNGNSYVPFLQHFPELIAAYERAGIDIYQMLQVERPADE